MLASAPVRPSSHLLALAIVAISALTFVQEIPLHAVLHNTPSTVAVLHGPDAKIDMTLALLDEGSLMEWSNTGPVPIRIHTPYTWEHKQYKGEIEKGDRGADFTEWKLTPNSSISFALHTVPSPLVLLHPTPLPLYVSLKVSNFDTGEIEEDVVLIQKKETVLWEQ